MVNDLTFLSSPLIGSDLLRSLLWWLAILSFFTFALSVILIPIIVGKLSQDCFVTSRLNDRKNIPPTFGHVLLIIFRNILGIFLVLAGIAMLFLPGQGLLTILLGSLLISFPHKKSLIAWLIRQPKVQNSMDWLRNKLGKAPFKWPKTQKDTDFV